MKFVKKFLTGVADAFRGIFTHIPVTFSIIIVFNVFIHILAFISDHDLLYGKEGGYSPYTCVTYIVVFLVFFAIGTFFVEICEISEMSGKFRLPGIFAAAAIAAFIAYKLLGYFFITRQSSITGDDFSERTTLCVAGYVIIVLCLSLYFCINKSKISFFGYAARIFIKYFQIYIVSIVMLIGTGLVLAIIYALFLSSSSLDTVFEIYMHCAMLIGGMYALPFAVYALYEPECEVSRFMEILVKYVMHVISLIAYVIIYIYMLKVIILREIPSNSVFGICTALFVCSMVIAVMCLSFEVSGLLQKAAVILPYVFSPFILLQVYSIAVRIRQYGVTPERYLGVVFIVFEVLYIALYTFCRNNYFADAADATDMSDVPDASDMIESPDILYVAGNAAGRLKMQHIFLVMALTAAFSAYIPGINVLTASKNSQAGIIKKYLANKDSSPSDDLVKKALGAAGYIKGSDYGEEYLYKIITKEEFEKLEASGNSIKGMDNSSINIYGRKALDDFDISGYDRIYSVDRSFYYSGIDGDPIDLSRIPVDIDGERELDLNDFVHEYIKAAGDNSDNVFDTYNNTVILSDGTLLYMTDLSVYLSDGGDGLDVDSLRITGYIFAAEK